MKQKRSEGWTEADVEPIRKTIHERVGPQVRVELEEAMESEENPGTFYMMNFGEKFLGVFKSRNDHLGIITYQISRGGQNWEEEFGTLAGVLNRMVELLKADELQ